MSHLHVQQLASIREEFLAVRASLTYLEKNWFELTSAQNPISEIVGVHIGHVRQSLAHLEITYIIRLFAEFEEILRENLAGLRVRVPYKM